MRAPEAEEEAYRVDDLYPTGVGGMRPVQDHDDLAQQVGLAPYRLLIAHVFGDLRVHALPRLGRDEVDLAGAQVPCNDVASIADAILLEKAALGVGDDGQSLLNLQVLTIHVKHL